MNTTQVTTNAFLSPFAYVPALYTKEQAIEIVDAEIAKLGIIDVTASWLAGFRKVNIVALAQRIKQEEHNAEPSFELLTFCRLLGAGASVRQLNDLLVSDVCTQDVGTAVYHMADGLVDKRLNS